MVTNELIELLQTKNIDQKDINALKHYTSRDGFEHLDKNDFESMMNFLHSQDEELQSIAPILTDNNSNYICVYIDPENKGKVCYLSHDEININPIFKNISNLIKVINENPKAWDIFDISKEYFDYQDLPN